LSREQVEQRFDAIAAFADIGDFIDQPVKTYSSGMYVRLAFAVIANVDADVLVVDEALAVGDVFFAQKCMRFLRGFVLATALMFLAPVFYPLSALPESLRAWFYLNPLTFVIEQSRGVIFAGQPPDLLLLFVYWVVAALVAQLGYSFFQKSRSAFADVL
jgi:hypothetical protein